jgi:hypothetical protein
MCWREYTKQWLVHLRARAIAATPRILAFVVRGGFVA